jgi:hypothetical protein
VKRPREITCPCGVVFIGSRGAKLCSKPCRAARRAPLPPRPRIYEWTPGREQYLREHYSTDSIPAIVRHFGWPARAKASVQRHADRLGLVTRRGHKMRAWSPDEIAYLEEHAGRKTVVTIANRLGRTVSAVNQKAHELQVSTVIREGYTIQALMACFGESERAIERWLALGLFGRVRYENGGFKRATPRDPVRLTEAQVHDFIRDHRREYRLNRVEPAGSSARRTAPRHRPHWRQSLEHRQPLVRP